MIVSQMMVGTKSNRHLLSFFLGVYKEVDKEETRWHCGQFTISFKMFKNLNLVHTFELQSKPKLKKRFSNCNKNNVFIAFDVITCH